MAEEEGKMQFVSHTSCKGPNLSFNDGGKQNPIDAFPLLIKEPDCVVDTCTLGQEVCTISVLPDEGNTSPQCTSQFTLFRFVKALLPYAYQSCLVDVNVDKGSGETLTSHDGIGESVHTQKVLQRQITDKSVSERCRDAPTNRWRKYKRAASFDSRKIVILFSILSSVGTLILIYLTLRVKQNGDDNNNI